MVPQTVNGNSAVIKSVSIMLDACPISRRSSGCALMLTLNFYKLLNTGKIL